MNFRPRRSKSFSQLPPTWGSCLNAFKLLIENHASVHETVHGRTLSSLNLFRLDFEVNIIEFFGILRDNHFLNFDSIHRQRWCALVSAIRSKRYDMEALRFLIGNGIDLNRIYEDGSTAIHWAAEMASHTEVLEQICSVAGLQNLNRQDKYGWTPLHYSIVSANLNSCTDRYGKMTYLLEVGADIDIKGRRMPLFCLNRVMPQEITPYELALALNTEVAIRLKAEINRLGRSIEHDEDLFEDALEYHVNSVND
jgi:ankyrin repeat protein